MSGSTVESFVATQRELLSLERQAEIQESQELLKELSPKQLQQKGVSLLKLRVGSHCTGLFGRCVVTFEPMKDCKLPSHSMSSGDIIGVRSSRSTDYVATGVLSHVSGDSGLSVSFEDTWDVLELEDSGTYQLVKLANDVTYRRLKRALDRLEAAEKTGNLFLELMFNSGQLSSPHVTLPPAIVDSKGQLAYYNTSLDDSQKEAVRFALCQREFGVIHGPPGTGKTTTVTEFILQCVRSGEKVLACAPSNVAVDNLAERLATECPGLVRLGHPARLMKELQKYSLDAVLAKGDQAEILRDVRKELDVAHTKLRGCRKESERYRLRTECKTLRKEFRKRETNSLRETLKNAPVVLATLSTSGDDGPLRNVPHTELGRPHFGVVVIDECSQALETSCWAAMLWAGSKVVLAGDPHQLPPTVVSQEASKRGLSTSLIERAINLFGDQAVRMLTVQYRMHQDIMEWSSGKFYQGRLVAHESVKGRRLCDLEGVEETDDTDKTIIFVDTAGCEMEEVQAGTSGSRGNEGEADLVATHARSLISSGLQPKQIAIISPYNLQVELLRHRLSQDFPNLEIRSVDGFQGREKEVVLLSLVRSNSTGEVGFLAEHRRLNVAITRARRQLAVFGDSATVGKDPVLATLLEHLTAKGDVRSAFQYHSEMVSEGRPAHLDLRAPPKAEPKKKKANKKVAEKVPEKEKIPDEVQEERKKQLVEELAEVMAGKEESRAFPATLASWERRLVHMLAEEAGLGHTSQGDGQDRHIVVFRQAAKAEAESVPVDRSEAAEEPPAESASDVEEEPVAEPLLQPKPKRQEDPPGTKPAKPPSHKKKPARPVDPAVPPPATAKCGRCGHQVPPANMVLHQLQCQRKSKPSKAANGQDEDFDAVVAQFQRMDTRCNTKGCKTLTATLGMTCPHCRMRFCIGHSIPEAHGCGQLAKIDARKELHKHGFAGPPKRMDRTKRAHLQRRLDGKLDEMAGQRGRRSDKSEK